MSLSDSSDRASSSRMSRVARVGSASEDPRMKSPFPGMDPYLEDQGRWPDFHASMITYCRDALSERLPPDYVAQQGEDVRVVTWQEGPFRPMEPDVSIVRSTRFHRWDTGGVGPVATLA